ncbi:response regulator [Sphingosinicellaceae bacterium]|nr:response regulator [Sphingosinicellaceae bacterium]
MVVGEARPVVLVVEDEAMIRMGATALVEDLGLEFYEASGADDAITLLEQHSHITIVFTDIQMAGSMDGLELAAYARKRWPPLKFIIVSGNHIAEAGEMPEGAVFFRKPYGDAAIGEAIRAFS